MSGQFLTNASRSLILCSALLACSAETADPMVDAMPGAKPGVSNPAGGGAGTATSTTPGTPMAPGGAASTPPGAAAPAGSVTPPMGAMPPGAAAGTPSMSAGVTYHKDIRAVIEANCVECHSGNPEFLIAPFPLADFASVMAYSDAVVAAVMAGKMPPWPASADCRQIADNRSLPPETRELLAMWKAAGFPEGSAADYVPPPPRRVASLGEPDLILSMVQPYMPRANDEYTCFGLGDDTGSIYGFPENTYMVAVQVLPGTPSEVHHVQLHRQSGRPAAGPSGCGASAENMFSWRPGSTPLVYPTGDAALIPQGAGFTIQVHYNGMNNGGYKPDQTKVAFWIMKEGTPKNLITRQQVFGNVSIPPGAANVTSGGGTSIPMGSSIVGITPHAHMLAIKMSATFGGECLIDVPEWDFNWQLDYMLEEPIPGPVSVSTTCVWDNTAENQPTVNGMKLQPRQVSFGEESLAEMCLHYIWSSRPMR